MVSRFFSALWLLFILVGVASAQTYAQPVPEISARDRVVAYNTGFRLLVAPGIFIGNDSKAGFALRAYGGYGFEAGSFIITPGASIGAYFSDPNLYSLVPQIRLMLPVGGFAPFIGAGAGLGYLSSPSGAHLSVYGEGGAMYYAEHVGIGIVVSYERFVGTDVGFFTFAPTLAVAF